LGRSANPGSWGEHRKSGLLIKKMETKVGITSDKVTPIHLCETLELVNKKFVSEYLLYFENCAYAIHPPAFVCLNLSVSITMPEIDLRFSPNGPLNLLASDLRTGNKV
jgi:hypothetical protein